MKSKWILTALAVVAMGCLSISSLGAADGGGLGKGNGPLQQLLDHAKELNLTDDQKTKVEALQKEIGGAMRDPAAMREKLKEHPELREIMKELKAARDAGDEAKLKELREKLRAAQGPDAPAKPGEGGRGEIIQKLAQILTPDQMQKLRALREQSGGPGPRAGGPGGKAPAADDKRAKPDASTGVPDPFDK